MQPEEFGIIFDIQRFCLHDGPGLRTVVFLKGCPMRCLWCANPESQSPDPELLFNQNSCMHCGACKSVCAHQAIRLDDASSGRIDRARCQGSGECASVCPMEALRLAGTHRTVQSIVAEVERDRIFFASSQGGVTFSGGEPLAQPGFLLSLLQRSRDAELNTAVETCGFAEWPNLEACLPWINHLLFDIKHPLSARHLAGTGMPIEPIIENLERLTGLGLDLIVRIPVIPEFNTDVRSHAAFADLFRRLNIKRVELLPYHAFGIRKYDMLARPYAGKGIDAQASRAHADALKAFLQENGIEASVGD